MQTRIWDTFTRIYHMSQLILLALLWYSGEQANFELHFTCGYLLLSLWLTRIFWGIFGSETSRFRHFIKSPKVAWQWFKRPDVELAGHNPLAGYMVIALLISLGVQLFSGLFATDDVLAEGPLLYYVSEDLAASLDSIHKDNFDWLLIFIFIHALAAIFHSIKADNVIKTILIGKTNIQLNKKLYFRSSIIPLLLWAILFALISYYWLNDLL